MENFAGLNAQFTDYKTSKIVVLPVPFDATSSWKHGADKAPEAILEASVQLEWLDTETDIEVYKQGIHTAAPVDTNCTPEQMCTNVEQRMMQILADGKFPLMLGGNHTVSIGAFRAAAKRFKDFTILQFDAHSDLRESYEGTPYSHACVMAHAKRLAPLTQIGIRSMCAEEMNQYDPLRIFWGRDLFFDTTRRWEEEALDTLSRNVYITIDLDVFDPGIMPATGTPEPGGLQYFQVLHFLRRVFTKCNVVGCDIVELCPIPALHACNFMAARLAYQLMTYKFAQSSTPIHP